ncbi:MAG TPA: GNAT family N-acetyltransferase [Chthoniobacterales bacterium]
MTGNTPAGLSGDGALPAGLSQQGIGIAHGFRPGDLGELIRLHGLQNAMDYGFDALHEAHCARIAADFLLAKPRRRSRVWLALQEQNVVGSVFIVELPGNVAQLRLLFVHAKLRGQGLGRWMVETAVSYARAEGYRLVFLWTVQGLERAIGLYVDAGFRRTLEHPGAPWSDSSTEVRYELTL